MPVKITISIIILAAITLISLSVGAVKISFLDLISFNLSEAEKNVIFEIRLPRILLAIIVGSALGFSGTAIQSVFRYPIADPSIIGVSSGAALFVALYIVYVEPIIHLGIWGYCLSAFLGGLTATFSLFLISGKAGLNSANTLVLSGLAVSFFASSIIGFLVYTSNDQQLRSFTFWTLGSLSNFNHNTIIAAYILIGLSYIILHIISPSLNLISLGKDEATYLGVNVKKISFIVVTLVALSVGAAVAVSGLIGFLGLIVPHLCRFIFSSDHKILVPTSAILGAIILLFSDTIARIIVIPSEIPVGIITSFLGAICFFYIIIKRKEV